jgi:folate-binding protein YgfZ
MTDRDERASLKTGAALLAPLGKEMIVARGADRVRFLHGVVTGDVAGTPVGGGVHALLLTPKAHVLSEMRIFVGDDHLYLAVAAGQGGPTAAALARYAVMDDFTVEVVPDFSLIALLGPAAGARLDALGIPAGALQEKGAWSHLTADGLWLARVIQLGAAGFWIGGPSVAIARVSAALAAAGTPQLGPEAAEAARITAGEPAWGQEITDAYFPMEVGLGDAINYTKGCFLGQEPIVRIRDRGHTNWRLAQLEFTAGARPDAGATIESDAKAKAGLLTSVAAGPDGHSVALAVVHVSVPGGASVRVAGPSGPLSATVREPSAAAPSSERA